MCLAIDGDFNRVTPVKSFKPLIKNFLKQLGFRLPKGMLNELTDAITNDKAQFYKIIEDNVDLKHRINYKIFNSLKEINKSFKADNDASDVYKVFNDKDLFSNISESSILLRESNNQIRGISLMQQLLKTFAITIGDLLAILISPKEHQESDVRFHLTTMHGSKGLEWDNVILIGLEDKAYPGSNIEPSVTKELPSINSKGHDELREERRLFYVAITRAIKHLHLIVPKDKVLDDWNRKGWSSTPKREVEATRFVFEMDTVIANDLITKIKEPKAQLNLSPRSKLYLAKLSSVS
jgi:DNA helicase-2/ATP-dependent DNA helicase PcrA